MRFIKRKIFGINRDGVFFFFFLQWIVWIRLVAITGLALVENATARLDGKGPIARRWINKFISVCLLARSTVLTIWKLELVNVNNIGPVRIARKVSKKWLALHFSSKTGH